MSTYRQMIAPALTQCFRESGFKHRQTAFQRQINEVVQFTYLDGEPTHSGEPFYADVAFLVFSPTLFEAVSDPAGCGPQCAQIHCSLAHFAGKVHEGGEHWLVTSDAEALVAAAEMVEAFRTVAMPMMDSIDTTDKVIEKYTCPWYSYKWIELRKWEIAVYRGQATLADRPRRNLRAEYDRIH